MGQHWLYRMNLHRLWVVAPVAAATLLAASTSAGAITLPPPPPPLVFSYGIACGDTQGFVDAVSLVDVLTSVTVHLNVDRVPGCTYVFDHDYNGTGDALPQITRGHLTLDGGGSTIVRAGTGPIGRGTPAFRALDVESEVTPDSTVVASGSMIASNFTVTGFVAPGPGSAGYEGTGGAVLVGSSASAMLRNCTISGNTAVEGGGAAEEYGTLAIANCVISNNHATGGGGGVSGQGGSVTISGSVVSSNHATDGGGIDAGDYSSATVSSTPVTSNTADSSGGGLAVRFGANVTLLGSSISFNTALDGGGIFSYGHLAAIGGFIAYNSATGDPNPPPPTFDGPGRGYGGGVYQNDCQFGGNTFGTASFVGGTIRNNTASFGAGLAVQCTAHARLTGTSVFQNVAARQGGGAWVSGSEADLVGANFDSNGLATPQPAGSRPVYPMIGGGIDVSQGSLASLASTFSNNDSGAIRLDFSGGSVIGGAIHDNPNGGLYRFDPTANYPANPDPAHSLVIKSVTVYNNGPYNCDGVPGLSC